MANTTTFDSTKGSLQEMLREIAKGRVQLPDFQRGWVWDDAHIRSLLASISLSYPIGAVMMLETGNPTVRFKPRLVEGVQLPELPEPEWLILDGQQRLTSLFQSLWLALPVRTRDAKGNEIARHYYVDIRAALDPNRDREEAIVSLPAERLVKNFRGEIQEDYSTAEREYEAQLFPLNRIFDSAGWRNGHNKFWKYDSEKVEMFDTFEAEVVKRFEQYQVPQILLKKETPKVAVCQVFEKVNTGGVSLTVFELLTATYAADDFNLRTDWSRRDKKLRGHKVLQRVQSDDFLQAATLLATWRRRQNTISSGAPADAAPPVSCKRKDVLQLTLPEYEAVANAVTDGFVGAARFLQAQKLFVARDLPYRTQLVPLAAILAVLGSHAEHAGVRAKIARWFWCGVFGELYGSAIETRFAKDLPDVVAWARGQGPLPTTIEDASFTPARLRSMRTRNSAAYKGLYALLIRDGCFDFRTGEAIDLQTYFDENIDIHHVFPKKWAEDRGIPSSVYDSIINKTPLSARTNRIIGGRAPSDYLDRLQRDAQIPATEMDTILRTHRISPEALRSDNFDQFLALREVALLDRIGAAMEKPIAAPPDNVLSEVTT